MSIAKDVLRHVLFFPLILFLCKGGKPLNFAGGNTAVIGCGNTHYDKVFLNIDPAANWVHDFEHNTSPRNSI